MNTKPLEQVVSTTPTSDVDEFTPDLDFKQSDGQTNTVKPKPTKIYSTKLYICCYILVFMYLGAFWCIPSAIFTLIQKQLHISTKQTGLLWSMYDIMYGCSAVISGLTVDRYASTHIYNAMFVLISIISLCTMHLIQNYILMLLIYIILAYSQGVLDCCIAVYIYKLFTVSGGTKGTFLLTICYLMATIVSTVFVPIIDLSLLLFGTYLYSMYILAVLAIPSFVLLVILPTPVQKTNTDQTNKNIENGTKLPMEEPQLTLINNFTSINMAGLLGLDLTGQNARIRQQNAKISEPNVKVSGNGKQSHSNTLTLNPTASLSINIQTTPTNTSPNVQISLSHTKSWFDVEIPQPKKYKNNVSFMEKDILESDIETNMTPQNKFDLRMETIRELQQSQIDLKNVKSVQTPRVIHDFNAMQSQKKLIKFFALINVCLVCYFQSQKVIFGAYMPIYTMQYMNISEDNALYFVTAFFGGLFCGKCLAIYLLKKYRADNIILFCCICMMINSMCLLFMHILFGKNIVNKNMFKFVLYFIVIIGGTMSSPLFNASYAFLSMIQPISGFVTSLLFAGYCIGGAITAYIVGTLCDQFGAYLVPYCVTIQIFICLIIAMLIKIQYVKYHNKYHNKTDGNL